MIIGEVSVCSKRGDGANWGYLWGYLIYNLILYLIKTYRYIYYSIPPASPNTSPRKSKEVLKALLIRAFFGFTTTPLKPIRPGGAGDHSAVGTAASPTTSHLPSCF